MNKTVSETTNYFTYFVSNIEKVKEEHVIFCVPSVCIDTAVNCVVEDTDIKIGAQNFYPEDAGAFTGEISAEMLMDAGADYVIIGHSERREIFKESDEFINKKLKKSLREGLVPILCVGESLEIRQMGATTDWLRLQLKKDLKGIDIIPEEIIIAYEPIWAIGTGETATPEQAEKACKAIRDCLAEMYSEEVAEQVTILYGGSVKASNAKELFNQSNIDGGLVGGASLDPEEFLKIVDCI